MDNTPIGFVSNKMDQKGSVRERRIPSDIGIEPSKFILIRSFGLAQNDQDKLSVTFMPSSAVHFSLAIVS
jgi:hypothetical protein